MLTRALVFAVIGLSVSGPAFSASSDLDDFMDAIKQGKYLCLTPDPSLGCQSYSLYKIRDSQIHSWNEVIVATNPAVVMLFSTTQSFPDAEGCWLSNDEKISEGPTFYRGGELLPDIERGMFENSFNSKIYEVRGNAKKICAVFSDGPKGRMIDYTYDGKDSTDTAVYISYHTRADILPLALGVKSLLLENQSAP